MSLQLHRPDERGALRGGKLPALRNPEMRPTSRPLSVLVWLGLAFATFVLIVGGYGLGIWHFPS